MEGQQRLKNARVLVVGAGGLGCPLITYLSSAGIGSIDILDGDVISISNLQRQILFTEKELGKSKAEIAAEKARTLNPHIKIRAIRQFLNASLAIEIFDNYDLIIDCTDNFGSRYLINDVSQLYGLPFVSAALHKFEGQLGIYNVKKEDGHFSASYRDVFPELEKSAKSLDCNAVGVLATLPGLLGLYQANEVIKYFLDKKTCLINKVLILNTMNMHQLILDSSPGKNKFLKNKEEILSSKYELPCMTENKISTYDELMNLIRKEEPVLIDVRELNELPKSDYPGLIQIPLSVLNNEPERIRQHKKVVFICKSGIRSKKACGIINQIYPEVITYDFSPGIHGLPEQKTN